MAPRDLRRFCQVTAGADALLKTAIGRLKLSARAYHRVLKIARTIADLAGECGHRTGARERRRQGQDTAGLSAIGCVAQGVNMLGVKSGDGLCGPSGLPHQLQVKSPRPNTPAFTSGTT